MEKQVVENQDSNLWKLTGGLIKQLKGMFDGY